ncbi:MAG: DUF2058 family protein [Myxococcaceae bacterium]|nr:DUF2058 family protein [Myxococcaceae bacterium]
MQSLRDKLLKAGLVTEDAAKKAETEKHAPPPKRREPRDGPQRPRPEPALPKFAPLPGSKEAHRQLAKKQLEADRELRERVLAAQVERQAGATPFYFVTRKNKLRRLELTEEQAKALEGGALAVVERPDPDQIEHALVPAAVARELLTQFPKAVRFLNTPGAAVGFLSEQEIVTRSHEAQPGETHESHDEPASEGDAPTAAPAEAPPDATWITVKRQPKP